MSILFTKRNIYFLCFYVALVLSGIITGVRGEEPKSEDTKTIEKKEVENKPQLPKTNKPIEIKKNFDLKNKQNWTAEQVAEVVILVYGGRSALDYVTTNGTEDGIIKLASNDEKSAMEGKFSKRFLRKESSDKDCVRLDVTLAKQSFTFGFNGWTSWAAKDGSSFKPAPEAESSFLASLIHDYQALLRYKEDGTTLSRVGNKRVAGIDTIILELTHKDQTKTRYYISDKTFHILHLEYEIALTPDSPPTQFRESFYDFRQVQGVLVAAKTMLCENNKLVQEIELKEIHYRLAKFDEEIFLH